LSQERIVTARDQFQQQQQAAISWMSAAVISAISSFTDLTYCSEPGNIMNR